MPGGALWELAGSGDFKRLERWPKGERIEASDTARGTRRIAVLREGHLVAALFLSRAAVLPTRDWLIEQLGRHSGPAVLAGRAPGQQAVRGAIVCACFDIGIDTIVAAIAGQGLTDVAAIGAALRAGTMRFVWPALAGSSHESKGVSMHDIGRRSSSGW